MKIQLPVFLYRLYDEADVLLYIGITENLGTRMDAHASSQSWWPQVNRLTVDMLPDRISAEHAEGDAIRGEKPRHNICKQAPEDLASEHVEAVRLFDGPITSTRDGRSDAVKIAAEYRAQIMSGELAKDSPMPSMPTVARSWGVSVATVQNAWKVLKREDLIASQVGKDVRAGWRQRIPIQDAEDGLACEILDVAEVEPPADVSAALGEDRAVCRTRLMLHGDAPVELSRSYYPASWAAGTPLAGRGKIRGGAPAVLAELGYPQREWTDRISTRPPVVEEAELLDVPEGVPVFRQFRVIRSDGGRVAEVTVMVKPGHRYELEYRQVVADKG